MKIILLAIPLILISCKTEIIETKLKVYYTSGDTEILTIKRHSNVIGKHCLFNGCLYRTKHTGSMAWDDTNYIGQIRCGVSYTKTISVRRYDKLKN